LWIDELFKLIQSRGDSWCRGLAGLASPEFDLRLRPAWVSERIRKPLDDHGNGMNDIDLGHLRSAIAVAWRARERGNHPFGAVLVDAAGCVALEAENTVVTERDPTGHAEANLVRLATRAFSKEPLAQCTMYASAELFAMCAGASHCAGIGRVVYALSEPDQRSGS